MTFLLFLVSFKPKDSSVLFPFGSSVLFPKNSFICFGVACIPSALASCNNFCAPGQLYFLYINKISSM